MQCTFDAVIYYYGYHLILVYFHLLACVKTKNRKGEGWMESKLKVRLEDIIGRDLIGIILLYNWIKGSRPIGRD